MSAQLPSVLKGIGKLMKGYEITFIFVYQNAPLNAT
jgi:hypothetical protein